MNNGNPPARSTNKAPAVQTFAQLLREVYQGKRTRLKLPKNALEAIQSAAKPDHAERVQLIDLAKADRTLQKTRDLMLFSAERLSTQPVATLVREFVGDVLRDHPAFRSPSIDGVLRNLPEAMNDDAAIEQLWSQPFGTLPWPEGHPPLSKKQAEQGRANALYCLLLWLRETTALPVERIQRHLASLVWEPAARRNKSDAQKLRALMSAKDRSALGTAYGSIEKRAAEYRQQAIAAREGEDRANARASELEKQLADANDAFKKETEALSTVRRELEAEKSAHAGDLAHARSELEDLRGRVVRKMREEVSLLDEGLRALRRDPPRVHVMADHAERAMDGLKRGIDEIKGEEGQ
jgi:hypothetical protein